ncbi:MAG TPA: RHS repeat-associated core domain-containing protein, partial [Tepidisphaeraceae bacterium]|nr:RHS repeat-associated core domain-containing protein [Tepidisphaeraceae bacterium]
MPSFTAATLQADLQALTRIGSNNVVLTAADTYDDGEDLITMTAVMSARTNNQIADHACSATIVTRIRPNNTSLTYTASDTLAASNPSNTGGDRYTGLDQFGQIVDQNWTGPSSTTTERVQYGYDRNSNVLYKDNMVHAAASELYHVNSTSPGDNVDAYDNFNRLTAFARGTLSSSGNNGSSFDTITAASRTQTWSLDALGNWNSSSTNGTNITRTTNSANELTHVGGFTLSYDNNGDLALGPDGISGTNNYDYDAWGNRLSSASYCNTSYAYDALSRRTVAGEFNLTTWTFVQHDLYYSQNWQVLQDNTPGPLCGCSCTTSTDDFVWGEGYVDDLVLRDRTIGGQTTTARLFAQQDANFNVTALVNTSGVVQERFLYDSYGGATAVNPTTWVAVTWTPFGDPNGWLNFFQGGRFETGTGLYSFRNRDYSPVLGRWVQADPTGAEYVDGANLYQSFQSSPVSNTDSWGLWTRDSWSEAAPGVYMGNAISEGCKDTLGSLAALVTTSSDASSLIYRGHHVGASALSRNDFRVNRLQFYPSVADLELPVHATLPGVAVVLPGSRLLPQ